MHVYKEINPTVFSGAYSQGSFIGLQLNSIIISAYMWATTAPGCITI